MATPTEEHGNAHGKTLFIRNLPYTTTNDSLEKVFSEIGPVKQCFVVSDKDSGKCRGFGYVKYTLLEDAQKCLTTVKKVDGRPIQVMFANKKEQKKRFGQPKQSPKEIKEDGGEGDEDKEDLKPDVAEIKEDPEATIKKANTLAKKARMEKVKTEPKAHSEGKRARLIVRNLSFKCKEMQLQSAFAKYGNVVDVHIPTKDRGKKLGFGFIQFSSKAEAGMAVKALNGQTILDRKVAVDFTLPKDKFEQKMTTQKAKADSASLEKEDEDQDESMDVDEDEIAEVKDEVDDDIKEEPEDSDEEDDDDDDNEGSDESDDEDEMEEASEASDEEKDEDDSDDEEDDDDEEDESDSEKSPKPEFERSSDVDQGKTIFIRNVSYTATDEDMEEYFIRFGVVKSARCVVDPTSGMSKGTAFVQFASKESAALCLKGADQPGQHVVGGRELLVTLAVDRSTASGLKVDKTKVPKDSRNLFLAREGMIRPGTQTAVDVPAVDLSKRLKNDAMKRKKLKDQNTFISSTRLCVHNLPATLDDNALRKIVIDNIGDRKKYELGSVKIMRDLNRVNSEGKAKSKGYGFVSFTTHEAALAVLQKLNNNANVFGPNKRPIVEFSIENRKALLMKEKRVEKSQMRLLQEREKAAMQGKKSNPRPKRGGAADNRQRQDQVARSMHAGGPVGLPRHSGAKQRHKPRPSQVQTKARKPRGFVHPAKNNPPRRQREPKFKQEVSRRNKGRKDTDSFDKMVASHKSKIMSSGISF